MYLSLKMSVFDILISLGAGLGCSVLYCLLSRKENNQRNTKTNIYETQVNSLIDYNIDLLKSIQWLNQQCTTRQDKKKFVEFEKYLQKLISIEQNIEELKKINKHWFLLAFDYKYKLNNLLVYYQGRLFSEKNKKYFKFFRQIIADLAHNIQLENSIDLETRELF